MSVRRIPQRIKTTLLILLHQPSFNDIQSQIKIPYSVVPRELSIASGFSARYHKHYYLPVSIPEDIAVIHFVEVLQTQRSKLAFHERILCRWEDGKATPSTATFLLQLTTPFYSHSQRSSTLILALHPRFLLRLRTLPNPNHECVIEADNGSPFGESARLAGAIIPKGFGRQRLFFPIHKSR